MRITLPMHLFLCPPEPFSIYSHYCTPLSLSYDLFFYHSKERGCGALAALSCSSMGSKNVRDCGALDHLVRSLRLDLGPRFEFKGKKERQRSDYI